MNKKIKSITDLATGNPINENPSPVAPIRVKNIAAVTLGRLGGLKGGKARAAKLSAKRRKKIAQDAAKARWSKEKTKE
ncbi:MAG TPA: hypothetical protein VF708_20990 [Pyrinomonadaceae bacterium]